MSTRSTCLILGGLYEGLALAAAVALAAIGHPIAVIHRSKTSRPGSVVIQLEEKLRAEFRARNWPIDIYRIKTEESGALAVACDNASEEFGAIGIAICAEGTKAYNLTDTRAFDQAQFWQGVHEEIAPFTNLIDYIIPHFKQHGFGRLINIGFNSESWRNHLPIHGGHYIYKNNLSYLQGKSVRESITSALALAELASGITCNTVAPGRVGNLSIECLIALADGRLSLIKRMGASSWDFAQWVKFIVSEEASFITGGVTAIASPPLNFSLRVASTFSGSSGSMNET
jgi:NAD(P)-dependent dehydrogenase (short-subunit alcohol dehydrogenase family)